MRELIPNKRRVYPLLHRCVQTDFDALQTFYPRSPGELSPGVTRPNRQANLLLLPSVEDKTAWSFISAASTSYIILRQSGNITLTLQIDLFRS